VKYAFIDKMAGRDLWWFSIALACELLEVSRSGFYDWRDRRQRPATERERDEQLLIAAITVEHIASSYRYGSPRIHAELVDQGWKVSVNRIARLMALHGLEGRSGRRRRHSLTRQAKTAPQIPDLLERDFTAAVPDLKWTTDISYVPTAQGWIYLAVIIDLCSRAVVGWAADTHMRTELVLEALTMALTARRPPPGLIVHSDYAEVCVKPRNGGFACAGGGRWLIPRLNEAALSEAVESLELVLGESLDGWGVDRWRGGVDGFAHHVDGGEGVERGGGRGVLVAEQPHDDRQGDALLVEIHGLGLAQHVAMDVFWN
jgi:hypothetical protein